VDELTTGLHPVDVENLLALLNRIVDSGSTIIMNEEENMMEEKQKALVVGVDLNGERDFEYSMKELANLAEANDIEVVFEVTQKLERINTAHYIGTGKIEDIARIIDQKDIKTVIFNDELSHTQIRNLEEKLSCRVIDRTFLILKIFESRAKTKEAQLQVEMATLQYMLPRLMGLGKSLGHQGGGSGLKNRGSGETKIELGRRKIEDRIIILKKQLEELVAERKVQRRKRNRKEIKVIALVGYTNAGKSTIMNNMLNLCSHPADKKVFEKDMLFATLETSVRNIVLPDNKEFLLTDTVGFISKLPHHLVKAFRSTLEEVTEADLLIHVVDYSDEMYKTHIDVTNKTLKELGVVDIPTIYAYNKIDLVESEEKKAEEGCVYISAKNNIGLDELLNKIHEQIFADYISFKVLIPYDKGSIVSYLNENANIKRASHENEGTLISLECRKSDYEKYKQYEV